MKNDSETSFVGKRISVINLQECPKIIHIYRRKINLQFFQKKKFNKAQIRKMHSFLVFQPLKTQFVPIITQISNFIPQTQTHP